LRSAIVPERGSLRFLACLLGSRAILESDRNRLARARDPSLPMNRFLKMRSDC
jgi:hypothetical protein